MLEIQPRLWILPDINEHNDTCEEDSYLFSKSKLQEVSVSKT